MHLEKVVLQFPRIWHQNRDSSKLKPLSWESAYSVVQNIAAIVKTKTFFNVNLKRDDFCS